MKRRHNSSPRQVPQSSAARPAVGSAPPPTSSTPPVGDLVAHPEKLDAFLKSGPVQIAAPGPAPAKSRVSFMFQRPARSVKIAGDFTDWEKSPIDMLPAGEGQWSAVISLTPGRYAYRFIVDGQWCEDPRCSRHAPNGFGSENSVVEVR